MTATITEGDLFPALDLRAPDGTTAALPQGRSLVYFMRTANCPICNSHLKHIARGDLAARVVVIVPGSPEDAAGVAKRHDALKGRVLASETAHAQAGLFVTTGLQRSGSFVVDADGTVLAARTSTLPTGAYSESEALAAMAR